MEQTVRSFFDQIAMSEDCAARIRGAMQTHGASLPRKEEYTMRQTETKNRFGWLGAAACLLIVLLAGIWVLPRTAPREEPMTPSTQEPAPTVQEAHHQPYERREDGRIILMLDRNVDITELLSDSKPVIYCYEPEEGTIHYYALGLSGPLQEIGWYYWEYNSRTKTISTFRHHCTDEAGAEYGWYTAALEKRPEQVMSVESGRAWENMSVGGKLESSTDPFWLREEEGKLYFTGDGQKIDISDSVSKEEPFLYTWEDAKGKATCIAVGGTYTPGAFPEGLGWVVFTKDLLLEENLATGYACWQGGCASNHYDNETGDYFVWYQKAKEHYNWPWA